MSQDRPVEPPELLEAVVLELSDNDLLQVAGGQLSTQPGPHGLKLETEVTDYQEGGITLKKR